MNNEFEKDYYEYLEGLTSNVDQDALWAELNTRLDSNKNKRSKVFKVKILYIITFFFSLCLGLCFYISKQEQTVLKSDQFSIYTDKEIVTTKESKSNSEQNVIANVKNEDSKKSMTSASIPISNREDINDSAHIGTKLPSKSASFLAGETGQVEIDAVSSETQNKQHEFSIDYIPRPHNNTSVLTYDNADSSKSTVLNSTEKGINKIDLNPHIIIAGNKELVLAELLENRIRLLHKDRHTLHPLIEKSTIPKQNYLDKNGFFFDVSCSFGSVNTSRTESASMTTYQIQLESLLNYTYAHSLTIVPSYKVNAWQLGLGISQQKLIEEFRLDNSPEEEVPFYNDSAYVKNDVYIGENQIKTVITQQEVYNRNSLTSIDLVPQLSYTVGNSKLKLVLGVKARLSLYSKYTGSLINEGGYLIKSGNIFDTQSLHLFSFGAKTGIRYRISRNLELLTSANYEKRQLKINAFLTEKSVRIMSLEIGLSKRF